jgi:hypothetical protein
MRLTFLGKESQGRAVAHAVRHGPRDLHRAGLARIGGTRKR